MEAKFRGRLATIFMSPCGFWVPPALASVSGTIVPVASETKTECHHVWMSFCCLDSKTYWNSLAPFKTWASTFIYKTGCFPTFIPCGETRCFHPCTPPHLQGRGAKPKSSAWDSLELHQQ